MAALARDASIAERAANEQHPLPTPRRFADLYPQQFPSKTKHMASPNSFRARPEEGGLFGMFGGRYVAEPLTPLDIPLRAVRRNGA